MARMTRRHFMHGLAAAGGAAALSAIATKAPAQSRGITLRALMYPYPVTKAIRAMVPEYEKATGVKVEWDEAPFSELLSKQMTELVARTSRYDLFTISNMWVGAEAGTGQLLALDELIGKADAKLDWPDILPKQRGMFTFKGKPYGIPLSSNIYLMTYNKEVFDHEGIKVPPPGASFAHDEWLRIVKRLTKGKQKGTAFSINPMAAATQVWSCVMMSAGGRFFDEKLTPVLNSKEGLLAAEYMKELMSAAPPDILRYGNTEAAEALMRGDVVTAAPQWASRIPMVVDKEKSKIAGTARWSTLPFAGWSGRKVGLAINDGWGITIPKASKYAREAFEFAAWCVEKEKQLKFMLETQVSPTRSSVFDRPELREKFIWMPVMKEQLANSFDFPILPEWAEALEKIGAELHAGWGGQYPIPKALDRANQLVADLLKERNYPVGTWSGAKLPWE
jgi:multiple sugar transport system substrate-binding protein